MNNFKIKTENKCIEIQTKLFKLGYKWQSLSSNFVHDHFDYLYCRDGLLSWGIFSVFFEKIPLPEITFEELMSMNKEEKTMNKEEKTMNKEEAQQRIDAIKKELAELEAIVNKPERWQDKLVQPSETHHYFITSDQYKGYSTCINYSNIHLKRKPEHSFRTQKQAELSLEYLLNCLENE